MNITDVIALLFFAYAILKIWSGSKSITARLAMFIFLTSMAHSWFTL